MAEFQYDNHIHSSTQQTPFSLNCGQHPRMGFAPQPPSWLESANEFTNRMKSASEEAKAALTKAKDEMARYYNQRRLPTPTYHPASALPQVLLTKLTCGSPSNVFRQLPKIFRKRFIFRSISYFILYFIFPWRHFYYFSHCAIFHLFSPSSHLGIYKYLIWQESSHLVLFGHPVR